MCKLKRNEVAKYLRSKGFSVSTSPGRLTFGFYTLIFDEVNRYVNVWNPNCPLFYLSTPYRSPPFMLKKIRETFGNAPAKYYKNYSLS